MYAGRAVARRGTVVVLPEDIDLINAARIAEQLTLAVSHGSAAIIDMTATTFCDCAGARAIVPAHKRATGSGAELRLVIAAEPVRAYRAYSGSIVCLTPTPGVEAARAGPDMNTGNGIRVSPQPLLASLCSGH